MTPPDDSTVWGWLTAGVATLGGVFMKGQSEKISDLKAELSTQRGHIGKIFDKLESNSQRAEDRHHELLQALHEGLSRKADK